MKGKWERDQHSSCQSKRDRKTKMFFSLLLKNELLEASKRKVSNNFEFNGR